MSEHCLSDTEVEAMRIIIRCQQEVWPRKRLLSELEEFDNAYLKDGNPAAFAEFDTDIIRENTINGMRAAKARGEHVGRPFKLTRRQIMNTRRMVNSEGHQLSDIAELYEVSSITLERAFARLESEGA